MHAADQLLVLVPLIYEAALNPERWTAFLNEASSVFRTSGSVLHLQSTDAPQSARVVAARGVDPHARRDYEEYYAARNIWTIRGRDRLQPGAVLTGDMVCPNEELEASEYYNDYLKPLDFYHALAAVPLVNGPTTLLQTHFRPRRDVAFGAPELVLQRQLTPHLQRAAQLYQRVAAAERHARTVYELFERLAMGVVVVDDAGRVVFANSTAAGLAAAGDGFVLGPEGPGSAVRAETTRLQECIHAARHATQPNSTGGGAFLLSRPSGKRPLQVFVAPLRDSEDGLHARSNSVAIFIADPEAAPLSDTRLLEELYQFTPSEARFAAGLLEGLSIDEVAERVGVTRHTGRWVVKQILQKTGTRSQAQALALLLRGLSTLRSGK